MPRQPSFICQNRHGTFYFRFIIPVHLRHRFANQREVRRSLRTDSRKAAVKRARAVRVQFDNLIDQMENMNSTKTYSIGYALSIQLAPDGSLNLNGETDGSAEDHKNFQEALSKTIEAHKQQGSQRPTKKAPTITQLGEAHHPKWLRENTKVTGNGASKLPAASARRYNKNAPHYFALINGDLPVNQIEEKHLVAFDEHICNLPARILTNKDLAHLRTLEDIKQAGLYGTGKKMIGDVAKQRCMTAIKQMLRFAYSEEMLTKNIGDSYKPQQKLATESDNSKRDPFDPGEIKAIFDSPFFLNGWRHLTPHDRVIYWMFILALYTGARRSELLFLGRSSYQRCKETGIPCLAIKNEDEDGQLLRTVKGANSIRESPLHDVIINLGFLDFVEESAGEFYLFPTVKKLSESTADNFSTAATKKLKEFKVHVPVKKTFHSFRHTVITHGVREAKIPIAEVSALTGHIKPKDFKKLTSEAVYLDDLPLKAIKESVVDKFRYGLKIEVGL